jgi:catalase
MVLDRNPVNYFAEVEQAAFGTGVMVDGLDFSDDKMLQGRTLSYSDTQRYRVGPNYLQLPINRPKTQVATNQRDGQMAYHVDGVEAGENPHVNYEPSSLGGLKETAPAGKPHSPRYEANLVRQKITRTNDFAQAGERYRAFETWERDELIHNLVDALKDCPKVIQQRMLSYFAQADAEYGRRVAEGIASAVGGMAVGGNGVAKSDATHEKTAARL